MTVNISDSISKEHEIAADILRQFRARGLSYGEARFALTCAQAMLQKAEQCETNQLLIADGIEARFNPDRLVLTTKIADEH